MVDTKSLHHYFPLYDPFAKGDYLVLLMARPGNSASARNSALGGTNPLAVVEDDP